jgi:hypothetical protein
MLADPEAKRAVDTFGVTGQTVVNFVYMLLPAQLICMWCMAGVSINVSKKANTLTLHRSIPYGSRFLLRAVHWPSLI